MKTIKAYQPIDNIVRSMRQIRDEISDEIKDMTFAEERAFLDRLLNVKNSGKTALQPKNKKGQSGK